MSFIWRALTMLDYVWEHGDFVDEFAVCCPGFVGPIPLTIKSSTPYDLCPCQHTPDGTLILTACLPLIPCQDCTHFVLMHIYLSAPLNIKHILLFLRALNWVIARFQFFLPRFRYQKLLHGFIVVLYSR